MMGFLDSFGDFAQGAIGTHLKQLEEEAVRKHDIAMANKALEREGQRGFFDSQQQKRALRAQSEREAAERQAKRDKEADDRKWERDKLKAMEAGRDRRAKMQANAPRGSSSPPKPQLFEMPSGEQVWVNPGDSIPSGARRAGTSRSNTEKPTSADDFLSRF